MTLSGGILDTFKGGGGSEVFKGGVKDMDLGSMLDNVPLDPQGDKGARKDERGVERLKERQEAVEKLAEQKLEALLAQEQKSTD